MVYLSRIYTRAGDGGDTRLVTGETRAKSDLRIEAFGTVDELNATLGLARLHAAGAPADLDAVLGRVSNDLFDLGADLATPEGAELQHEPLRIVEAQVTRLEGEIDAMNAGLEPLRSFILPGGGPLSAHLHLARTVCRRAERLAVALARAPGEGVGAPALKYLNRLSDHLFVAARIAAQAAGGDVLWVPGQNR